MRSGKKGGTALPLSLFVVQLTPRRTQEALKRVPQKKLRALTRSSDPAWTVGNVWARQRGGGDR